MKKITLLFFFTLCNTISVFAYDIEVKNTDGVTIYYNYINNRTELMVTFRGSYSSSSNEYSYSGNVVIPSSVTYSGQAYNVTSIGHSAFSGCSGLTSVTIPSSVTSIDDDAFKGCKEIERLVVPNSVQTIGNSAFCRTHLKSLTIGSGVKSIGRVFYDIIDDYGQYIIGMGGNIPEKGTIPVKVIWLTNTPPSGYDNAEGTVNYVANNLYTSLSNKTVYPFLSSMFEVGGIKYVPVSPSERTCDAIDCVYNYTAENINIGETVSYQGVSMKVNNVHSYACYNNKYIKDLKISCNGDIGTSAFYGCTGIQTATINNNGSIETNAFNGCTEISTAIINNKGDIGEKAFYGCATSSNPATFTISNTGNIGASAFAGCTNMQTANVDCIGTVGYNAFQNCGMQTATLGEKITSLGDYAFSGCSKLQSIIVPDGVTGMGNNCFSSCTSMTSAKIGSGIQAIPTYAFSGCSKLTDMQIGQNVQTINTFAFADCKALESITIPKSVTSINNYVFSGCSALKNVTMEDREDNTVFTLGSNGSSPMFSSCPLDEVYIGRNISYNTSSSYGYSPFYRKNSLRSVTITDKETEISENEFYGCTNLKEVKIGDGVTTIGNWAFSGCSSLDFFSFGSAVQTIGQEAFSDCTAMTKLISKAATPPTCGTQALDDINKWNCKLYVPTESLSQYQQADQWKEFFFIEAGIKNVNGNNSNKATIKSRYDLGGKQISQPQKGLNILKMSDGTTRKVVR